MNNVRGLHSGETYTNGQVPPILDERGDVIAPRRSFMEKIDNKAKEQVTLSKGTLWLIATVFILAQVLFSYGGSLIGWARSDEGQSKDIGTMKTQIDETRNDVKDLNRKFDDIQKILQQQAVRDAEQRGYKLGVTAAEPTGSK